MGYPTDAMGGTGHERGDDVVETTGRYIVVLSDEAQDDPGAISETLSSSAGITSFASTSDFEASALDLEAAAGAEATVFPELGIAVVAAPPDQGTSMMAAAEGDERIIAVEPERVLQAIEEPPTLSPDYLRGYRDAASHLYDQVSGSAGQAAVEAAAQFVDESSSTWGLQATRVTTSRQSGRGIRVAVLDTGFALDHPDFAGETIEARSFVPGQAPQDVHGHGTHTCGTACGPAHPAGRRYGVASSAEIFVGKVLNDAGRGTDTNIIAGITWAVVSGCRVISMSLGANIRTVSMAYETIGRRALARGSLIVAAAGNNARRSIGDFGFVGIPANSPSIMAVAAVDQRMRIADFSARSNPVLGGQVDIAAPGVGVYSSWPMPRRYNTINGTSMATPHVAGIAALWSEATGATGDALRSAVLQAARRLSLPSVDVGAGLAQAPR
jgi:subtilisin